MKRKIQVIILLTLFAFLYIKMRPYTDVLAQSPEADRLYNLAWSPDGSKIVGGSGQGLHLWDATSRHLTMQVEVEAGIRRVAWNADSSKVAAGTWRGTIIIWDITNGQFIETLESHNNSVGGIVWSHDDTSIISAGYYGGGLARWDSSTLEVLGSSSGNSFELALSPDGSQLLGVFERGLEKINLSTVEAISNIEFSPEGILAVDWNSSGDKVVTGNGDGTLLIWDTNTWQAFPLWKLDTTLISSVEWNPVYEQIAVAAADKTIYILDAVTGESLNILIESSDILDWSPDGTQLVYAGDGIDIEIIDLAEIPTF